MKIAVGIVGVTGYSGQELLRIMKRHPGASVEYLASQRLQQAQPLQALLPLRFYSEMSREAGLPWTASPWAGQKVHPFRAEEAADRCDVLFSALPHGQAMKLAPRFLRNQRTKLIDLSGDFRLKSAQRFRQAYGARHASSAWLRQAAYGLTEWNRSALAEARLVANPGCYPTAALLALGPLAAEGLLDSSGIFVDAKSGVSGAGRSLKEDLLFCEVNEDLRAYQVNAHPHIPEMEQALEGWARRPMPVTFVPHLIPLNRGLYATAHVRLKRSATERQIRALIGERYRDEPFVRLLPEGIWPQVKAVAGTNECHLNIRMSARGREAILLSAIDNLGKGAAGQAVQNMNLLLGLPETAGLMPAEG